MAQMTKEQLKNTLIDGHLVRGSDFANIVDSLKGMQTPVGSPAASSNATAFIDSISQDEEGRITATKKNVNFSGYQTVAGMANYQQMDLQQVGEVTATAGGSMTVNHNMKHYPTVRLLDETGVEVKPSEYTVKHSDIMTLSIELSDTLTGGYTYILD